MTEERYRLIKLIFLAVFVFGALGIGGKISDSVRQLAENGHYLQYDRNKDIMTTGTTTQSFPSQIIDTRTGAVRRN